MQLSDTSTAPMPSQPLNPTDRGPVKQGRIPSLDGLRAVSILMVLIGHASATVAFSPQIASVVFYFSNSSLGVLTFFVISGYLITYLLRKEWEKTGSIALRDFYRRRVLRIFPAFYSYLFVISALTVAGVLTVRPVYLVSAGLFLWNYSHLWITSADKNYWFIGHFWTLALEEQFYLFWPLTLQLVGLRRAPYVALALICVTPLLRVGSYFLFPGTRDQIPIMLHTAGDALMFGCLTALLEGKPGFECYYKRISSGVVAAAAALFLLVISPHIAERYHGTYTATVGQSLNCAAVICVLLWLTRNSSTAVGRLFNSRLFVHVGVLSYSLYLWQQPFLTPLNRTWTGIFPLNLLCGLIAAEASYYLIERPFLALRHRKKGAVPAAAGTQTKNGIG